jgi:hypothetical protein
MTLNIEDRSKELAAGFVKHAAVNWKQPVEAYLGGATSGGLLGGLIGSGIGSLKGAVSSARAAEAGFGNKLKAALKGGAKGGFKGGLIGTGVGAGLGTLQVPYGIDTMQHIDRRGVFDAVKDLADRGSTLRRYGPVTEITKGSSDKPIPWLPSDFWHLVDDYKNKGADVVKDKLKSYNEFPGMGLIENTKDSFDMFRNGILSPLVSLGRILGGESFQPF